MKIKAIRATFTIDYYVDMIDENRTLINGWTIEEVIEDWFENWPLDRYHATRDGHIIGNSKQLVKTEVIEL